MVDNPCDARKDTSDERVSARPNMMLVWLGIGFGDN